MIVFAAFTPHTPLLIPTVAKDRLKELSLTDAAMTKLAEDLYAARPDTIVLISSHHAMYEDAFAANLHHRYEADLSAYGDLSTPATFQVDAGLTDSLQRHVRSSGIPFSLHSIPKLDHGCAVPLLRLCKQLPGVRIVPIAYAEPISGKDHVGFGRALKDVLMASPRRIAVIASGDLSHALSAQAPEGERPEGAQFDEIIRNAVEHMSASTLLQADEQMVKRAAECAMKPLLVLFGVLDRVQVHPEILAYEHPFGVGYLTAHFHLG